ncbi:autotransporter outer membrane beta-barrel domain-containing protein [Asticcacaulis benevestitus]
MNAGTLQPGAAGSALQVKGDFIQTAGGTLQVAVNAAGESSQLQVSGSATLDGTLSVLAANGTYNTSTAYSVISSTSLTGEFSSVKTDLAFLTPQVTYNPNGVTLTLTTGRKPVDFSSAASTTNEHNVAVAVQAGGEDTTLYQAVLGQSIEGARSAFNMLSGEAYASVTTALLDDSRAVPKTMLNRLRQQTYGAAAGESAALGTGEASTVTSGSESTTSTVITWAEAFGGRGKIRNDGNAASLSHDRSGFMTGMDARFGQDWRAGAAAGYTSSSLTLSERTSFADVDTYNLGLYAGRAFGRVTLRLGGAVSWSHVDMGRLVSFPSFEDALISQYDARTAQMFGEMGYGFVWKGVAMEPFAGLSRVHQTRGAAQEQGGDAALNVQSATTDTTYSTLGLRSASRWIFSNGVRLVPRMTLGWQHAFGDLNQASYMTLTSTGNSFKVNGVLLARDAGVVELGLDWKVRDEIKVGLSYQGTLSKNAQDHAVTGVFSWVF